MRLILARLRALTIPAVAWIVVAIASPTAVATTTPFIGTVTANASLTDLTITGINLRHPFSSYPLKVYLGNSITPLPVLTNTGTLATVALPSGFRPGSYLLAA